jgi:hypothetical protein
MPYAGSSYSVPTGTRATTATAIDSSDYNAFIDDIEAAQNAARPVATGGTGASTAIAAFDALAKQSSDIASASTIVLNNATGPLVNITGTTTCTAITLTEGKVRFCRAVAAFQFTASSSLVVNGSTSQDYTTSADDLLMIIGGSSKVYVWSLPYPATATVTGTNELYIPATAFTPQLTNGAAAGISELATNLQPLETLDFDTSTQEFASILIGLPKRWDRGTVTAQFYWTAASGSGGVVWALQGVAVSNDDALNPSWGTEQVVADTFIAANDMHVTSATSAITIGGSPADGDGVWLRVKRVPANGSDTLAVDAKLIGVKLFYTVDQGNDA